MANSTIARLLAASCLTVVASQGLTTPLHAAEAAPAVADDPAEIIVTANKREESARTVPMSLTIASGDKLLSAGVRSPEDLVKIVPGLTVQPSPFNTPVYTMRGIGFYETSLSAAPTVAVYVDEVPLPFSATTKLAVLDLQRVEVLKGPQGTLFGQNTTGGAINYIAAQPTAALAAAPISPCRASPPMTRRGSSAAR
ncbi:TonB-dependent receptor plug domain-containing protein [Rhizorhabdus histidinilytica]